MAEGIAHDWQPFTEDVVICAACGDTIDEAAPEAEFNGLTCTPDPILYAVGGMSEDEADRLNGFTKGGE